MDKAIADKMSRIEETNALVNKYGIVGANILYQRSSTGGHLAESMNGNARAFDWLSNVLDENDSTMYSLQGYAVQNVTVNITSLAT